MPALRSIFHRSIWLYALAYCVLVLSADFKLVAKQRVHYLVGVFYNQNLKNYRDGIVYYDFLVRREPQRAVHYANLGICYYHLGNLNRAVDYYRKAADLDPKYQKLYQRLLKKSGGT